MVKQMKQHAGFHLLALAQLYLFPARTVFQRLFPILRLEMVVVVCRPHAQHHTNIINLPKIRRRAG